MISSYIRFWKKMFSFSTTSSRSDYWWPIIINYLIMGTIISAIEQKHIENIHNFNFFTLSNVSQIILALVWIATISVKIRRLHDSDHTGWWLLINIVPIIGNIWFFILMVFPSKNSNRWTESK